MRIESLVEVSGLVLNASMFLLLAYPPLLLFKSLLFLRCAIEITLLH
jgi:hypothetical protein